MFRFISWMHAITCFASEKHLLCRGIIASRSIQQQDVNYTRCDSASYLVTLCFVHRECFKSLRYLRCLLVQGLCFSWQRVTWEESDVNHQLARVLLIMIVHWEEKELLLQVLTNNQEAGLLWFDYAYNTWSWAYTCLLSTIDERKHVLKSKSLRKLTKFQFLAFYYYTLF